jgi:hypothetical protein
MLTRLRRLRAQPERGSTLPLILGFWLITMLFIGGAIALSNAYTHQEDLQSACDGAAIVAANAVDAVAIHNTAVKGTSVPLGDAEAALARYLSYPDRQGMHISQTLSDDHASIHLKCTQHTHIAFEWIVLRPDGLDQTAQAPAQLPTIP